MVHIENNKRPSPDFGVGLKKYHIIAKEDVVSFFPIFMMVNALIFGIKNIVGDSIKYLFLRLKEGSVWYLYEMDDWQRVGLKFWRKVQRNPAFFYKIYRGIIKNADKSVEFSSTISKLDLDALSNKKLLQYYLKYVNLNTEVYKYGICMPLLDFQDATYISDELKKGLVKIIKNKDILNTVFINLTTPHKESIVQKESQDILKIISYIQKNVKLNNFFKKNAAGKILDELPRRFLPLNKNIDQHIKKYNWIYYVYEGPPASKEYFIEYIKDFINRKNNAQKQLADIKQRYNNFIKDQKYFITKYNLPKNLQKLAKLAADLTYVKVWRREQQSHTYYYIEPLLQEISNRLNLSLRQFRMMKTNEVRKGLLKKIVNEDVLNQRYKLFIWGYEKGKEIDIIGKKAEVFVSHKIYQEKVNKNIRKLYGTTACIGKAKGIIKIINKPQEMAKMNDKDILVAASTNPNLITAIKKAAAIITDEGGLTCHAAIVSRELGIPCVVGTKIATRILKDGDKVEVNAFSGIVRKLK